MAVESNTQREVRVRFAIAPEGAPRWIEEAVRQGGGAPASPDAAEALIWSGGGPDALEIFLAHRNRIRWVQLPTAGVESFAHMVGDGRIWTCAKGAFSQTVAEHALALALGLLRNLKRASGSRSWDRTNTRMLGHSDVLIVGGGGIGAMLALHLAPFDVRITVVRRGGIPVAWATRTITMAELQAALATADVVFLAVPLTSETDQLIGYRELEAMKSTAILVNVSRGRHIVTDDLVRALDEGRIAGAGLDVTDPEPLPDGHPLWLAQNCIITSHSANSDTTYQDGLARRIATNVERYLAGRDLLGVIEPSSRY